MVCCGMEGDWGGSGLLWPLDWPFGGVVDMWGELVASSSGTKKPCKLTFTGHREGCEGGTWLV